MMNRQTRAILIVLGLALLILSALALIYAVAPAQAVQLQQTLAPTLFAPPVMVTP